MGELDRVQRISCKPGDLLGDDKVEFVLSGILYHAVEVFTLLCGNTGKTLVNIAGYKGPRGITFDKVLIVGDLISK